MKLPERKTIEKIVATSIIAAFMGQFYVNPFSSDFRFSFSVVALSLLLIYFKDIPVFKTCCAVSLSIFLLRTYVYLDLNPNARFLDAVLFYYPVVAYYLVFGIVFKLANIRDKTDNLLMMIVYVWFCDSISNIAEVTLRNEGTRNPFERVVLVIIFVGMLRSFLTAFIHHLISYYMNRYEHEQKEKRYREMILFIANLKSELFFLQKSSIDIEEAMKKSFSLYERLDDEHLKEHALTIAKDIHEIKKDYTRVISGIEKTLIEENSETAMQIKNIFAIIKQNTEKMIALTNKKIELQFKYNDNIEVNEFYPLISVLNNLIINSIEAIDEFGFILIEQSVHNGMCCFMVKDTGKGIRKGDLALVFAPGFSTKFNEQTGEMSTGIGLTHVKHIIEHHFEGTLSVESKERKGTTFSIAIPLSKIISGKWLK